MFKSPLNSGILGLILKWEREKKGCTETWWSRREKSAPTQHHLLLFQRQKTTNGPRRERGRQRRRRIRRRFNSSVQLRRQFLPLPASLIKYLASESVQEKTLKDLCSFSYQKAGTVLLGWSTGESGEFYCFFALWVKWNYAAGVLCVCVSARVCVGKCRRCLNGALLLWKSEHQLGVTQIHEHAPGSSPSTSRVKRSQSSCREEGTQMTWNDDWNPFKGRLLTTLTVHIHDIRRLGEDLNAVIESPPPSLPRSVIPENRPFDHIDMHRWEKRNEKQTKSPRSPLHLKSLMYVFFFFLVFVFWGFFLLELTTSCAAINDWS